MPGPVQQFEAGGWKQLENETGVDSVRDSIAKLKQCQADIKAKEIQEKRKREEDERNKSREQISAQINPYRAKKQSLNFSSMSPPATSTSRPATSMSRPVTFMSSNATPVVRPATSMSSNATPVSLPATSTQPPQDMANVLDGIVRMKMIILPGNRTMETDFDEECTVQDLREEISRFLKSSKSRSPEPHNFRMWPVFSKRELAKPLATLRQLQLPRECLLLVLPPDVTPPFLSSPGDSAQIEQILASLNSDNNRNDTDDERPQENNEVPDQDDNNENPTHTEGPAPKKKRTPTKKSNNTKSKKASSYDPYIGEQFYCKQCLKIFGTLHGLKIHITTKHTKEGTKNATEVNAHGSITRAGPAVSDREQPKKKTKKEQKNVNINITVNNTVNNGFLRRCDFYDSRY